MSDESLTPESFPTHHITSADETDTFNSEARISVDDQFKKFKNELRNEKRKWNVFEETGTGDKSVSERRYDKSLQKKYKYLKLFTMVFVFIVTLGSGIVSKGATIFMVSQIRSNVTQTACPEEFTYFDTFYKGEVYGVQLTETERIGWIWALFFCYISGEVFVFIRCFRVVFMKSYGFLRKTEFLVVWLFETLHVIGTAMLFFLALPQMNSLRVAVATNVIGVVPSFLKTISDISGSKKLVWIIFDVFSILCQIGAIATWTVLDWESPRKSLWLPLGLVMISFGWWESFVTEDGPQPLNYLWKIKEKMSEGKADDSKRSEGLINTTVLGFKLQVKAKDEKKPSRGPTYLFLSLWKMGLFLTCMVIMTKTEGIVSDWNVLFKKFTKSFETNEYILKISDDLLMPVWTTDLIRWEKFLHGPTLLIVVQMACSWITYTMGKFAYGSCIEGCFALAMSLVTPVTISSLLPLCVLRNRNPCQYTSTFPKHLFYHCPKIMDESWVLDETVFMCLFWFGSFLWITSHIWIRPKEILEETQRIFSKYYYHGLLGDSCLMLNRKCSNYKQKSKNSHPKKIPTVKGCATMWHENSEEIKVCLKSMFKMDEDFCVRELMNSDDRYEWESNIFFDDAMMKMKEEKKDKKKQENTEDSKWVVNDFVVDFVDTVNDYGTFWYKRVGIDFPQPTKMVTPYGGRLSWKLPGGTSLICHLKDKNKIRHKKRWSQIMYMYYFLGFQVSGNKGNREIIEDEKSAQCREAETKDRIKRYKEGQNIFLLALDGDVDFLPDAVMKVLDIMKKNDHIGAACGRIHPTGSNYMKWLQQYEYAFGHWMQKATEHVLGCVLCSPGCFSLFRGSAVMSDNVIRTYTTVPKEAKEHIQYDQGEDRWLCTLMLKEGWRVEYTAASDSFTACPLAFKEFYNQRRRWMPSTLLNVLDLLMDWKEVVRKNDNISAAYILYQFYNNVCAVMIGPGFIVLMLIGASSLAFGLSSTESLILNLVLVGTFIFSCCYFHPDQQIMIAQLLTLVYAIFIIAVYVGVFIQIGDDGPLSISAIALYFTLGPPIICAFFHPQEINDVFCFPIYLATVPSMYLLLTIYAFFNMDDSSWGTRETPKTEEQKMAEAAGGMKKQQEKAKSGVLGFLKSFSEGHIKMPKIQRSDGDDKKMQAIIDKLDRLEKTLMNPNKTENATVINGITYESKNVQAMGKVEKKTQAGDGIARDIAIETTLTKGKDSRGGLLWGKLRKKASTAVFMQRSVSQIKEEEGRHFWFKKSTENEKRCKILNNAKEVQLDAKETIFWDQLIEEYLAPLQIDQEQKEKTASELREFKIQVSLAFVLINAMFVTLIFMLQAHQDLLGLRWPLGAKGPILTFSSADLESANVITLNYEYLKLDPIGLVFVVLLVMVVLLMCGGMFLHRVMTIQQIVAHTDLKDVSKKNKLCKEPVEILEEMREIYRIESEGRLPRDGSMADKIKAYMIGEKLVSNDYFDAQNIDFI